MAGTEVLKLCIWLWSSEPCGYDRGVSWRCPSCPGLPCLLRQTRLGPPSGCEVPWVRAYLPPIALGHEGSSSWGHCRMPYGRVTLDQSRHCSDAVALRGELRPHFATHLGSGLLFWQSVLWKLSPSQMSEPDVRTGLLGDKGVMGYLLTACFSVTIQNIYLSYPVSEWPGSLIC